MKLRAGKSVGRTLYNLETDELVGMMDSPELAEAVVRAVNGSEDGFICVGGAAWNAKAVNDLVQSHNEKDKQFAKLVAWHADLEAMYQQVSETLTRAQATGSRLVLENRELKDKLAEVQKQLAGLWHHC